MTQEESKPKVEPDPQKSHIESRHLFSALKRTLDKESYILTGLLIISLFYTLYFASTIITPLILALLINALFAPLIRNLRKLHIPSQASALLIILVMFFGLGYLFYGLSGPAGDWLKRGPEIISGANAKLYAIIKPLEKPINAISNIGTEINKMTNAQSSTSLHLISLDNTHILGSLFSTTSEFLSEATIMIIFLYFLLAYEDFFLIKLIKILPRLQDKKDAITITRETETKIGSYLMVRTIINAGLAVVMTFLMFLLKMPDPLLWGVMAGVLEFIPYLGVLVGTIVIGLVALISFDNFWHIIAVPVVFFTACSIEGNFVTPIVLGRQFDINPIAVFLAVIFWGWMWGIIGAIIAIPLMVVVKIIYENLFTDSVVGELLDE